MDEFTTIVVIVVVIAAGDYSIIWEQTLNIQYIGHECNDHHEISKSLMMNMMYLMSTMMIDDVDGRW